MHLVGVAVDDAQPGDSPATAGGAAINVGPLIHDAALGPCGEEEISRALARMLLVAGEVPLVHVISNGGAPSTTATSVAPTSPLAEAPTTAAPPLDAEPAAACSPPARTTTTVLSPRAATTNATTVVTAPAAPTPLVPSFKLVYSRRQRQPHPEPETPLQGDAISPARPGSPNSCQRKRFLVKISKKTARILPTPMASRLRSRACAPCAPRRSRRIAGMEPDVPSGGTSQRAMKKVMRAQDLIGETAGIDQQSLERYCKLFTGSARLLDSQALALSALFGWAAPDEEELRRVTGC
ncbi:hypothetical protein PVAP13_8KG357702 [Panicum virgatum]|uniref:Uncharacterized protein n=1 Tax=Panicum virgatum TaxID=38727 RepID=A0A8T0PN37_PANVG|nr:hypothetical protein PVAP13_8KG357702 [Panicum virgatum]